MPTVNATTHRSIPVLVLLVAALLLPACGKSYQDSPATNPVRPLGTVRSTLCNYEDGFSARLINSELNESVVDVFEGCREDPNPGDWEEAGRFVLSFKDTEATASIVLYHTPEGYPDAFELDGVTYVKENIIEDLKAWMTETQQAFDDALAL